MTTDAVTQLSRALAQMADVLAGIGDDQADLPTPCRSWNVGALASHVVHDLRQFTVSASGGIPDMTEAAPKIDQDWAGKFRDGARVLLEAWGRAGDLTGTVELPGLGEVPMRFRVDQQIAELAIHTWDLARATGQRPELDQEIGQLALNWLTPTLPPQLRGSEDEGKLFAPEVPVAADAPVYDRLAAFAGRDPS